MSDPIAQLTEIADRIRGIPSAIDAAIPHLVSEVDDYLQECAARGVDPDGVPWIKTERGRTPKITGATRTVAAVGSTIYVRVAAHDAMHSKGSARGSKIRRLVPAGPVPPALAARMRQIIVAELDRVTQP